MRVLLTRKTRFSAGHRYTRKAFSDAENLGMFGADAGPHGLGCDYVLEATLGGEVDPATGMVVNISELKELLQTLVSAGLEAENLTPEHSLLGRWMPTTPEVLVSVIWRDLESALGRRALPAVLERVRLERGTGLRAERAREEGGTMTTLTRSYEFSAAHRLHSAALSDEENRALFGKCNNPNGHGHNYELEVTVGGEPDARTGRLVDLQALDTAVHEQVVDRYDHRHLNLDVPEFRELNPTSENVVRVIWSRLEGALAPGILKRVTLRETDRNSFTCESP